MKFMPDFLVRNLIKVVNDKSLVINDVFTFIKLRSMHPGMFCRGSWGGGNFLQALGLFSLVNLYLKIYFLIKNPDMFISSKELDLFKKTRKKIKTCKKYGPIKDIIINNPKTNWHIFKGSLNETEAFCKFVEWLRGVGLDLGIKNGDAAEVWKIYRNALTHTAFPGDFVKTFTFSKSISDERDIENKIRLYEKFSFSKVELKYVCNVDRFYYDVLEIKTKIVQIIEESPINALNGLNHYLISTNLT